MLQHRTRKSILKKRVAWDLIEDLMDEEAKEKPTPTPTPQPERQEPEIPQTQNGVQNPQLVAAARKLEDMFKYAESFRNTLCEGFLEDIEALKAENRRHATDVADQVIQNLQHCCEGFENKMMQMHAEFGKGTHFYQIETAKLMGDEIEKLKHELTIARSETDRIRQQGKTENQDHLEALREIVHEQKSTREKVGVIYCFGANSVPNDFLKKIVQEVQVAIKKKQCPPYLSHILELSIDPSKRKLRQECGLQVQCQYCDQWFRDNGGFKEHQALCKKDPITTFLRTPSNIVQKRTDQQFQCLICCWCHPEKVELVDHLQTKHTHNELRRFNLDKLFAGKQDLRRDDWLWCLNDEGLRFRAQHIKNHFCNTPACNNLTLRLRLRLRDYSKRQEASFHPYHEAEADMELIRELQILLRYAYETSEAELDALQLKK